MERYLINYLKENSLDEVTKKYIDFFKIELDWSLYYYGDHIIRSNTNSIIYKNIQYSSAFFKPIIQNKNKKNILSSVSFKDKKALKNLGFNPISSVFQPVGFNQILGDIESVNFLKKKSKNIKKGNFNFFYNNKSLYTNLEQLEDNLVTKYSKYNLEGLLLFTDQYFESKYLLDIFKKLNRPSFIFSHGLPAIYSLDIDNRSDYLMVWGEQIKQNYIDVGFDPDKIFVTGCPFFNNSTKLYNLRNSLENILIIPPSSFLMHQHEWDEPKLIDRSMIFLYLYSVQKVLKELGVKNVRVRPHRYIVNEWVSKYIDSTFYKIDNEDLNVSLNKSTLVIGTTSTVFLQALLNGVNYLIYEPSDKERNNLMRQKLVPPFDGSDPKVEVARNETELKKMLLDKYMVNKIISDEYLSPLNINVLKELIK